jgi:hypothetical protein
MDRKIEVQAFPPKEFCFRNSMSPAYFYKLKREGRGPRQMQNGNITADAEKDWQAAEEALALSEAAQLEHQRRSEQASRAGKLAASSPRHYCRLSPAERRARKKVAKRA